MEDRIYLINLYDYYGDLLTEKQKEYFESYYFANLSLSEISENTKVSRNAVHKQLKEVKDLLEHYEEILKLYAKKKKINDIIKDIDKDIKDKIEELI